MILPQELQAARVLLAKERPYLASAAWALQPIPRPGLKTLGVDRYWRLYYDPAVLTEWSVEGIEAILYHEICHLLRNHAERMKDFDPRLSNVAADAEINDDLIREKLKFPVPPLTPQSIGMPENLLAEEYYAALENGENSDDQNLDNRSDQPCEEEREEHNNNQSGSQNQPENQESGPDDQSHASDSRDSDVNGLDSEAGTGNDSNKDNNNGNNSPSDQKYDRKEIPAPGSGRCGSCATGQMEPWENSPPGKGSSSGLSKTEAELIRRDVANQIKEYTRGQGRVPGHWARWAQQILHPQVDWRKQLAAAIRRAAADMNGATDYSYRRPSRRQGQIGKGDVIFPSMRCPVPTVAIIADTSASISDKMLAQTMSEIAGILKALGQKQGVYVLAVDQTVHSCRRVFRPEQIQLAGGGGTDMGAGLAALGKLKPIPQLGIVITDGLTSWPEHPPRGIKIIVVLSGDGQAPDWANVIKIGA